MKLILLYIRYSQCLMVTKHANLIANPHSYNFLAPFRALVQSYPDILIQSCEYSLKRSSATQHSME